MAQELTSPANEQFVTLKKTPEALTTVFHATGGRVHAMTGLLHGVGRRQAGGGEQRPDGARADRKCQGPIR
jgi:hypothetical protein